MTYPPYEQLLVDLGFKLLDNNINGDIVMVFGACKFDYEAYPMSYECYERESFGGIQTEEIFCILGCKLEDIPTYEQVRVLTQYLG